MEARGHEIVGVAGTSIGALVGGVYAAGKLSEVEAYVRGMTGADLVRLTDISWGSSGLIRLRRVMSQLHEFIGDVRIEDLPITFTAVATDIKQVREVWFRSGPLGAAIRASIAIPGVFTPVRIGDRLLVDGGVLNPLPMGATMDFPGEVSVGVSLFGRGLRLSQGGPSKESSDAATPDDAEDDPTTPQGHDEPSWSAKLGATMADWVAEHRHSRQAARTDRGFEDQPNVSLVDVVNRTLDVMQGRIELARTALVAPDVVIWVPMESAGVLEFQRGDELIDLGRKLAAEEFDKVGL